MAAHVWVATSGTIEHSREVGRDGLQERSDGGGLVRRLSEQVGEPSAGEVDRAFGVDADCRTDGGDEWARGGEDGDEGVVRALVGSVVCTANAAVTCCVHDGDAARTEGTVDVAKLAKIVFV